MKNKKHGNNKIDKAFWASVFFAAAAIITVIYYMLGPSEGYIHSDCVDTLSWAMGSVESGKLFSDTFCYPYLLPFGATSIFLPFAAMFGFSMLAYRLSMLVFMVLFGLAIYFCLRGLSWSRRLCLCAVSLEFMLVSSSGKLRELFWEHIIHYSLGAFLAFTLLAFMFWFLKYYDENDFSFNNATQKGKRRIIALSVLMGLWSFFSALDGTTTLALSTVPVLGAIIAELALDTGKKLFSNENKGLFISFAIIFFSTALGALLLYLLSKNIGAGYGSAYSNITDRSEWSTNALKFLDQWTSLLGADYEIGGSITSGKNILAAIKLAGSLVLFFTPVAALFIYKKLGKNEKIFVLFHWFMTLFILYGYVLGSLSSVNWRLSPIVCSAAVVNIIAWKYLWNSVNQKRGSVLAALLVVLSCVITLGQIWVMPADYGRDNDAHQAVEFLKKKGLTYGYATYWNANLLTLLSSSEVKVRDVNFDEDMPVKGWLNTDKAWYEDQPNQDKYFVLFTQSEYEDKVNRNHIILDDTENVFIEGNWVVLVKDKNITFK